MEGGEFCAWPWKFSVATSSPYPSLKLTQNLLFKKRNICLPNQMATITMGLLIAGGLICLRLFLRYFFCNMLILYIMTYQVTVKMDDIVFQQRDKSTLSFISSSQQVYSRLIPMGTSVSWIRFHGRILNWKLKKLNLRMGKNGQHFTP